MSTSLLPEVVPKIDANKMTFLGAIDWGGGKHKHVGLAHGIYGLVRRSPTCLLGLICTFCTLVFSKPIKQQWAFKFSKKNSCSGGRGRPLPPRIHLDTACAVHTAPMLAPTPLA